MTKIEYNGMTFSDENDQIISGEIYDAVSLISDVIEVGTFKAEVRVADDTEGQKLRSFKRNDQLLCFQNNRQLGVWYVENVERTAKYTYEISANNAVALLDGSKHYGGIYTGQTAGELIADICTIPHYVKPSMASQKLYGWLPVASRRINLAQVLFAIGAYAWVDEVGLLRIGHLWDGVSNYIGKDSIKTGDKVKYASKITEVSVLEHQYVQGAEDVTLFDGTSSYGDIVTFNEPAHSLTASGVTILESGANYVKISAGTGTITGKKYIHTTRDVRMPVSESDVENVKEVKAATLVSLTNSTAVAKRLAAYYKCCETVQHDSIFHNQAPGAVISFDHPFGGDAVGCIKSTGIEIGAQKIISDEKIISGFLPPQPSNLEYYDERVLLTGSGTWTVPEGVTTYTKVLIGGGQGGKHGGKGEDGKQRTASWSERVLDSITYNWSGYLPGAISKGGVGGEGGAGGKVLVETVNDATPGESIAYSCGAAGAGATTDGAEGENGTATTMGGSSSDSGSSSDIGYTDPVTGEVFAAKGDTGIAGGDSGGCSDVSAYQNPTVSGFFYVGQGIAEATDVVDEDGKVWKGGAWLLYNNTQQIYGKGNSASADGDLSHGAVECSASCSGPSGAAVGANGSDGSATKCFATAGKEGNPTYMYAYASPGYPVNGANAATAPKKTSAYGKGGRGGHGGGAGGCGGYSATGKTTSSTMTQKTQANTRGVGTGGLGSVGGEAGDGCIIIYYHKKKEIQSGAVMDKTGRFVLDRTGRLMVV